MEAKLTLFDVIAEKINRLIPSRYVHFLIRQTNGPTEKRKKEHRSRQGVIEGCSHPFLHKSCTFMFR
jgi:hypothetical protein